MEDQDILVTLMVEIVEESSMVIEESLGLEDPLVNLTKAPMESAPEYLEDPLTRTK